jgi:AhpD family alkylhydroperoxidase
MGSRIPDPQQLVPELAAVGQALFKAVGNAAIPQTTISLVQLRAGQIVGSTYLTALHTGNLRKAGESEQRIDAVATWRDAACFTAPERTALALVDAVLQPSPLSERVSDHLFAEATEHYDDTAIATLALVIGQVCFFMPLALIGKPLPAVPPTEQWQQ